MNRFVWRLTFALCVCVLCIVALSCGGRQKVRKADGLAEKADSIVLFANNCAKCHGDDGRATNLRAKMVRASNLTDAEWQGRVTDEQIAAAIELGPKAMPAFEKKLRPSEIQALVGHIRSLRAGTEEAGATP
ncbi:c-type cytochrome [Candidatus Sumerlaeota bacterium]|nr:c-type cytochrome [Candidatus Sumerlaeota bacterium]